MVHYHSFKVWRKLVGVICRCRVYRTSVKMYAIKNITLIVLLSHFHTSFSSLLKPFLRKKINLLFLLNIKHIHNSINFLEYKIKQYATLICICFKGSKFMLKIQFANLLILTNWFHFNSSRVLVFSSSRLNIIGEINPQCAMFPT